MKEPIEDIEEPAKETCDSWERSCDENDQVLIYGKVCLTCEFYQDAICVLFGEE